MQSGLRYKNYHEFEFPLNVVRRQRATKLWNKKQKLDKIYSSRKYEKYLSRLDLKYTRLR